MLISPFNTNDELQDEFTSNDFSIIEDFKNWIQEESDPVDWDESISSMYEDIYLESKKESGFSIGFGSNVVQTHFIFYNLYKLVENEDKAMQHVNLAHQFYKKNTLSYQWENVAYNVFRELYGQSAESDCVLPNNKRPDLVINPIFDRTKYHPRGSRIVKADKIIDLKTSVYSIRKELSYYKDYCDELQVVYLEESEIKEHENVTFISSEELIEMVSLKQNVDNIRTIQSKIKVEYIINEFDKRMCSITATEN